jgi:hypothetical protein
MKFVGISKEDLDGLHRSMEILEGVYGDNDHFRPVLFAIVNQGGLLQLAADAIREAGDYEEQDQSPVPAAIAVAIPMSSDALYYLAGSGLMVGDEEEFAYTTGDSEGIRTGSFIFGSGNRERLSQNQMIALAVAEDDTYLDEFLTAHGPATTKTEQEAPVERTESVSAPEHDPNYKVNPPGVGGVQSKSKTSAIPKGIDKVLITGKRISELKVTEIIEVSDFVLDHRSGAYLHAETASGEWLFWSKSPDEGKEAMGRMLMFKEDLDNPPEVQVLSAKEVEDILETVADEELGE